MKHYNQPKTGTDDKQAQKDIKSNDTPKYVKAYSMLQFLQAMYKGDVNNEWQ